MDWDEIREVRNSIEETIEFNEETTKRFLILNELFYKKACDIAKKYHEIYPPKTLWNKGGLGNITFNDIYDITFEAEFVIRGCKGISDETYTLDIPIEYLWHPEPLEAMKKEHDEELEKELQRQKKYEEECCLQKEEYDKKEYERLRQKFESEKK